MGYNPARAKGATYSDVDACLLAIQMEQNISYAAPLAGWKAGHYTKNGCNVLVTKSPKLIEPCQGQWPKINAILLGMFGQQQIDYVYSWWKVSLSMFYSGQWQPGQVFAMAGPPRSAKSLLQLLFTESFGGRAAHPYQYMTNATTFNGDLFAAEHLVVDDEAESVDIRVRQHIGAVLKSIVATRHHHCHAKYQTPVTLDPLWRLSISLNDEAERLLVLPPLNSDIADKICLFKITKAQMPLPTDTAQQQDSFWKVLVAELPAFIYFLLNIWKIPNNLVSPRFGVHHYHHPELVEALVTLAPEQRLLDLIDEELFSESQCRAWVGKAVALEHLLRGKNSQCQKQADKLLSWGNSCGTFLGRLERSLPQRVKSRKSNGHVVWTIQPPPKDASSSAGLDKEALSRIADKLKGTGKR